MIPSLVSIQSNVTLVSVVIIQKEIPIVCLDSDSDEEVVQKEADIITEAIKKPEEVKRERSPIPERPVSRHPPPLAVNSVAGIKTDFTVTKSKPVKTKLIIQRNLGDVLFDPQEIKRAKKEKMKEYIRLKEIERGECFNTLVVHLKVTVGS